MAQSLFEHGSIRTTLPKALEVQPFVEKLITRARKGDLHSRRLVIAKLRDRRLTDAEQEFVLNESGTQRTVVQKLFAEIAPRYGDRPGGYTRIIKLPHRRLGDGGDLVCCNSSATPARPSRPAPPASPPASASSATSGGSPSPRRRSRPRRNPPPPRSEGEWCSRSRGPTGRSPVVTSWTAAPLARGYAAHLDLPPPLDRSNAHLRSRRRPDRPAGARLGRVVRRPARAVVGRGRAGPRARRAVGRAGAVRPDPVRHRRLRAAPLQARAPLPQAPRRRPRARPDCRRRCRG